MIVGTAIVGSNGGRAVSTVRTGCQLDRGSIAYQFGDLFTALYAIEAKRNGVGCSNRYEKPAYLAAERSY